MAVPTETKLRKEQHKQSKARKQAEPQKEPAHPNPEDLRCSKCDRRFRDRTKCAIHVAWCSNDHKCAQCPHDNTKYPTDRALHRHWGFYHKLPGCSFCQLKPFSQDREEHERECHPKEYWTREYRQRHRRGLKKCLFCTVLLLPQERERHELDKHPAEFEARHRQQELQKCHFCKLRLFPEDREDHERESHPTEFHDRQRQRQQKNFQRCSFCEGRFSPNARWEHERERHPKQFKAREYKRQRRWEEEEDSSEPETDQEDMSLPPSVPDHYKTLGVARDASAEEIERVAKIVRIRCHPDRLKRNGPTPEEVIQIDETAKNVGWAADVLCDRKSRERYDREYLAFYS